MELLKGMDGFLALRRVWVLTISRERESYKRFSAEGKNHE